MTTTYSPSPNAGGGTGFFSLLQVALIVLKLIKKIDWPWWVVFAPTWALIIIAIVIIGAIMIIEAKEIKKIKG